MAVDGVNNNEPVYWFKDENEQTEQAEKSSSLDKDAFLRLLMTQMSHQDPLNPMEDKDMLAQLAQFSSLEQMNNLNTNFNSARDEILDSLENMNKNQIDANIEILKEVINIKKAIEAYGGDESQEDSTEG